MILQASQAQTSSSSTYSMNTMKSLYINIVIYVTAVIILRWVEGASVSDDDHIQEIISKMHNGAAHIRAWEHYMFAAQSPVDYVSAQIENIISSSIPGNPPYCADWIKEPPNIRSKSIIQIRFCRAYHALVFEKLKTFFIRIQMLFDDEIFRGREKLLAKALGDVWNALYEQYKFEASYRAKCACTGMVLLKLPHYDPTRPNDIGEYLKESSSIGHDLIEQQLQSITALEQACKHGLDDIARLEAQDGRYHGATVRRIVSTKESRFRFLESTKEWNAKWNYRVLNQLALEDRCLLPLCLAHERLIVARAQTDVARMGLYITDYRKGVSNYMVTNRLSEFTAFIECHKRKINEYEKLLEGSGAPERNCVNDEDRDTLKGTDRIANRFQDPLQAVETDFLGIADRRSGLDTRLSLGLGTITSPSVKGHETELRLSLYHDKGSVDGGNTERNRGGLRRQYDSMLQGDHAVSSSGSADNTQERCRLKLGN
ncbi:hypothetical protein SeLEV6574_g06248 [Synchytrium endobioticum]|uniref:Uncharacterized protein n=1 Tax=Synchytrium endobioticum TaxID=286115 RepID=A0A507CPP9_9FUNG|nr:hypothetical protein SeLEV6574_g06248 [Synchytrium endobioticum]